MAKSTVVPFELPSEFSPDPLTEVIQNGAKRDMPVVLPWQLGQPFALSSQRGWKPFVFLWQLGLPVSVPWQLGLPFAFFRQQPSEQPRARLRGV